jgi:hypothetical protein
VRSIPKFGAISEFRKINFGEQRKMRKACERAPGLTIGASDGGEFHGAEMFAENFHKGAQGEGTRNQTLYRKGRKEKAAKDAE